MGNLTTHFDSTEFKCPCCGVAKINKDFVERLEQLHKKMNAKAIVISSGYRCAKHSLAVGGYANDAHVLGFAADLIVYKQDGSPYTSKTVAYYAEQIGFGGIGLIDENYIHLDDRDRNQYANNHWFGNEATGQTYTTFQNMTVEPIQGTAETNHKIKLIIDGVTVFERSY